MPGTTTNRGYITYDRVTDVDQLFIDFRDDTSGSTSASNIYKIDADVQGAYDDIVALQGTGWVSTETVHSNSTSITSLKSKTFYQALGTASVANTYIADISGITSYYAGLNIIFTSTSANTGNCTVNINGLGAVTLTKMNSSGTTVSLTANDISNGNYSGFTYNGTVFVALWLGENSAIKINGVANAVNEITISNSVTGAAPTVATTGTDPNINLNLVSKGTGTVQANGYDVLTANTNTTVTPTVALGMNSVIKKTNSVESFPKFTMQGKSYTNLLGKDGNFETTGKWTVGGATETLDTTNKVFGANGVKLTLTATAGYYYKAISSIPNMDITKYYFISAYLKNGNATNLTMYKDNTGGGTGVFGATVTSTTGFTRTGFVVQPSQMLSTNLIAVNVNGAVSKYAYVDGFMITEITSAEYALGATAMLDKYPYVDSYASLQNTYIEVRHDNLVRNGNGEEGVGWWNAVPGLTGTGLLAFSNNLFNLTVTGAYEGTAQAIKLKSGTSYYINATCTSDGRVAIYDSALQFVKTANGYFTTGATLTDYYIVMQKATTGSCNISQIHIIEGTTAPTSYKPCRIERCVVEGKFTSDDTFTLENGEVTGLLNWKHRTLFGKDYDWQYMDDWVGYKRIKAASPLNMLSGIVGNKLIKFDGKILVETTANTTYDQFNPYTDNNIYLGVADTNTGWAESIAPNADEVKAFMNGWKAVYNNGTRYITFISVLDGSAPSGAVKTAVTSATTGTTINVTAGTGTQYAPSDVISIIRNGVYMASVTVSSVTANTVVVNVSSTVAVGDVIIKADNGSTNVSLLTWCKNNVAPNYEGYQIHYKLANPEPITDVNTHIIGDIPKFSAGDNYIYVDHGNIITEIANPVLSSTTYYISNTTVTGCNLRYQSENILAVYKNGAYDPNWTIGTTAPYGNKMASCAQANFDVNSTYSVDYVMLRTMHTSPTSTTMSYKQDIISSISSLSEIAENKQCKNNALETAIAKSTYEDKISPFCVWRAISTTTGYIDVFFSFTDTKKTVPKATVKSYSFTVNGSTDTTFILDSAVIKTDIAVLTFKTTNTTTVSNIKSYGVSASVRAVFDCNNTI